MADSIRLAFLKLLTTHLEAIEIDGQTLEGRVFRGRRRIGDETAVPCITIFELPPEDPTHTKGILMAQRWSLGIQGFVEYEGDHPMDAAHNFLAATKQRIFEGHDRINDTFLHRDAYDLKLDGGMTFPPDETTNRYYFAIKLSIDMCDSLGELYEQ